MRRLFLGAVLLCSLVPANVFADSLTVFLAPNDGVPGATSGFLLRMCVNLSVTPPEN